MLQIVLVGFIVTLVINAPMLLYSVWSWRLLRRRTEEHDHRLWIYRNEVALRLVLWAAVVAIIWPLWAYGLSGLAYFLVYDRDEATRGIAFFVLGVVWFPFTLFSWITGILFQFPYAPGAGLSQWVLLGCFLFLLLVSVSLVESIFCRHLKRTT